MSLATTIMYIMKMSSWIDKIFRRKKGGKRCSFGRFVYANKFYFVYSSVHGRELFKFMHLN